MLLQSRWGACLLLIGAVALSGCGLKYDLYLPEDETNPQNQAQQADPADPEAYAAEAYADSFMDDDSDVSAVPNSDPQDPAAAQHGN